MATLSKHQGTERTLEAVAQLKAGDMSGLSWLYGTFAADVRRSVAAIIRDEYEAEDVTHDVFAKLPRVIRRYEGRAPFRCWVVRVARNAALDHLRARHAVPVAEVHAVADPSAEVSRSRGYDLCLALAELPEEQRRVVVMRHFEGLSPGEIATRMGRSEPSVHGLHNRGRASVRRTLTELGSAPLVAAAH